MLFNYIHFLITQSCIQDIKDRKIVQNIKIKLRSKYCQKKIIDNFRKPFKSMFKKHLYKIGDGAWCGMGCWQGWLHWKSWKSLGRKNRNENYSLTGLKCSVPLKSIFGFSCNQKLIWSQGRNYKQNFEYFKQYRKEIY